MTINKKTQILAALSAFQIVASVASASPIKKMMIAENKDLVVMCDVAKLDRKKTQDWPGAVIGRQLKGSNESILTQVNEEFAGGNYFDEYPHKLPDLFKSKACTIVNK